MITDVDELAVAEGRPDPALDAWLDDVSAAVEHDVHRAHVPWDFAAMLARAHALDPAIVSAQAVAEAEQSEPVVSLAHRRAAAAQGATHDDPAFARLIDDVRAATEHDAALRMNGVTPLRAHDRGASPMGRLVVAAVALAAAVVLGLGVVEGVHVLRGDDGAPADAALHQGSARDASPERAEIDDAPRVRPPAVAPREPVPPEPAPLDPTPREVVAAEAVAPSPAVRPTKARAPKVVPPVERAPSLAERLAVLDGEAHAAWKANDLTTAEAKFEALIELAGTSRLADLAYGDLFTLARRRGDAGREVALWKTYLRVFPEGRFADDARAGLCRRDASDRPACWRAYLEAFPEGSYRAQAEREAGGAP
ncbi:MAG: hypothetical protein JNK45_20545 [Myxococcales bacterium]|nr:hypothetical protein [Myxococcales bacterium]